MTCETDQGDHHWAEEMQKFVLADQPFRSLSLIWPQQQVHLPSFLWRAQIGHGFVEQHEI